MRSPAEKGRLMKAILLSGYLLACAAAISGGLAWTTHDTTAAWVAFLVSAAFAPLVAYGRYFVSPEDQGTFKRGVFKYLRWSIVAIVVATLGFVVFLVASD